MKRRSISGRRLSASASARARSAPATSARQSTSVENNVSPSSASGASPRRFPATYAVDTATRWAVEPSACSVCATLDGPSRFTATAASSGESKETAAAEWMTTSTSARAARSASSRPSPSTETSPPSGRRRRAIVVSKPSPHSRRRRSKASLRRMSRRTRSAAPARRPGRTSGSTSQSGTQRRIRSTRAVPRNPVAPVTAIRRPANASAITGGVPGGTGGVPPTTGGVSRQGTARRAPSARFYHSGGIQLRKGRA